MPTVACLQCNSTNRVPQERLSDNPNCGRCGAPLFQGMPVTLTAANFDRHVEWARGAHSNQGSALNAV